MSFVHESGQEFADLLEIVAAERGLRRSIVADEACDAIRGWVARELG